MDEHTDLRTTDAKSMNERRRPATGAGENESVLESLPTLADAGYASQSATAAPYLLTADELVELYRARVVSHRNLERARAAVMRAIHDPGGARLVLLFGPTCVGKSTLLDEIVRAFEAKRRDALEKGTWNPGHIPILRISLHARGERPVSFINIYKQILRAADEPLIEHKRAPMESQVWRPRIYERRLSEADLSWAVESMLRHRKPAAILIDEAQHLALRRSPEALKAQLECLKSLADATDTVYVLVGSYGLMSYRNSNAQLSARSLHLHFPRYRLEDASDMEEFRRVAHNLVACLPLEQPLDLERYWEDLYRYSGGMVGALKTWLCRALKLAVETGATSLAFKHLEETAYEDGQIQTMIAQAVDGETALSKEINKLARINELLGFTPSGAGLDASASGFKMQEHGSLAPEDGTALPNIPASASAGNRMRNAAKSPAGATSGSKAATRSTTRKPRKRAVGERNPGRDRTGQATLDPSERSFRI